MITSWQLQDLVREEATNLKNAATAKELDKLNFETLCPSDEEYSIYGKMTGHCFSSRADDLIKKCCNEVLQSDSRHTVIKNISVFDKTISKNRIYLSPIEYYSMAGSEVSNKNLISYLKGEADTLIIE